MMIKMKAYIKIILQLLIVFSVYISCSEDTDEKVPEENMTFAVGRNEYYVTAYREPDTLFSKYQIYPDTNRINILNINLYYPRDYKSSERIEEKFYNVAEFQKISTIYNDGTYGDDLSQWISPELINRNPALLDTIKAINVWSEQDYDATHKKGDLLNDMITIRYWSAREWIDSDVRKKVLDSIPHYIFGQNIPIEEKLEDFNRNSSNNYLIGANMQFIFNDTFLDQKGEYTFVIEYLTMDGKRLTTKTNPVKVE